MMSLFIYLDNKSNPVSTQKFDSAPGIEIIIPPNALYIQDASTLPTDFEILDHWRLKNGVLADVGPNPGIAYYWDVNTEKWLLDLPKAKAIKLAEIKDTRDSKEFGGFEWDGSLFDSDVVSQTRIQGAVQLALLAIQNNQPFSIDWTLKDNSVRTLTGEQIIQVGIALAQYITHLHEISRGLKVQVNNATTLQQVESITWPAT